METNEVLTIEKNLIEKYFDEPAVFISEKEYPGGILKCWKNEKSFPTRKACSLITKGGSIIIPNIDDVEFSLFFLKIEPNLEDVIDICRLITVASPSLRTPIQRLCPYMQDIVNVWHSPNYNGNNFETFIDNSTSGRLEIIKINYLFQLTIQVVGMGKQFNIR